MIFKNKFLTFVNLILIFTGVHFAEVSSAGQQVPYGFTANDPVLSKNIWISYLLPNSGLLREAIEEGPGDSLWVAANDIQCHNEQESFASSVHALWQFPPSCDEADQMIQAQILLNAIAKKGSGLSALLSTGSYKTAWAYADQNNIVPLLETPIGLQAMGQKPFTQAQMTAFYLAAAPYWKGNILGTNPYCPTLWGDPSKLGTDAVTNFRTTGDNQYPDIARFAGKQPSEGFFEKWAVPIVEAVAIAAVTFGVGEAVAAGVDAGLGATTSTISTVAADGSVVVSSSVETAGGTLLSTSVSTLASDGTLIAGSTVTTSTVAGTAISVGSSTLASTAVAAAEGQNVAGTFGFGILGGAAMGFINSEFPNTPSVSPGSYATQGLENLNVSSSLASFAGSTLNLTLENSLGNLAGSTTKSNSPAAPVPPTSSVSSRAPASIEPRPTPTKPMVWDLKGQVSDDLLRR